MKTPEELALEYAHKVQLFWDGDSIDHHIVVLKEMTFLAGYQAGRSNSEAVQAAAPQWISVKDRLPEEDGPILVWSGRLEDVPICAAAGYELWNWSIEYSPHDYRLFELSHWMPLPKKPEE